jgi:hypothetical protein
MTTPRHSKKFKKPEPQEADFEYVQQLKAEGFIQVSSKYRRLAKSPQGEQSAIDWLKQHDPERYQYIKDKILQRLEEECRSLLIQMYPETLTLTPEQFEAWRQLGFNPFGFLRSFYLNNSVQREESI